MTYLAKGARSLNAVSVKQLKKSPGYIYSKEDIVDLIGMAKQVNLSA
jgi:hypothetical protein